MPDRVEEVKGEVVENFSGLLDDFLNETQSPIEKLFALKMIKTQDSFYVRYRMKELPFEYHSNYEEFVRMEVVIDFYFHPLLLLPQFKVRQYHTIDFLLYLPEYDIRVAIECDGHDFHEKTKEQAKRDKQRDRWLVVNNFYVFRYSGSEIYENVDKIYYEIGGFLIDFLQRNKK